MNMSTRSMPSDVPSDQLLALQLQLADTDNLNDDSLLMYGKNDGHDDLFLQYSREESDQSRSHRSHDIEHTLADQLLALQLQEDEDTQLVFPEPSGHLEHTGPKYPTATSSDATLALELQENLMSQEREDQEFAQRLQDELDTANRDQEASRELARRLQEEIDTERADSAMAAQAQGGQWGVQGGLFGTDLGMPEHSLNLLGTGDHLSDDDVDTSDFEGLLDLEDRLGSVACGVPQSQINRYPTYVHLGSNPGNSSQPAVDGCAVCKCHYQTGDTRMAIPCQHNFHMECIRPWLEKHPTCPVCRVDVRA